MKKGDSSFFLKYLIVFLWHKIDFDTCNNSLLFLNTFNIYQNFFVSENADFNIREAIETTSRSILPSELFMSLAKVMKKNYPIFGFQTLNAICSKRNLSSRLTKNVFNIFGGILILFKFS